MDKINEDLQLYTRLADPKVKHRPDFVSSRYVSIQDKVNNSVEYESNYINKLINKGWYKLGNNTDIFKDVMKGIHFKYRLNGNSISGASKGTFRSGGIIIGKKNDDPNYLMYKAYNGCLFPLQIKDIQEIYIKDPNIEKTERTNKAINKTVYFKEPTNITSFPVKLISKLTNEEIVIYYAKDNYTKDRFMNTKKFEYAYKTGDWSFL
jgi:hypothetical protein